MAFAQRIWNLFRSRSLSKDLRRELSFHVAERAEELQAAGLNEHDALRQARLRFGNYEIQTERTRDMDIHTALDQMLRNLRLSVRALRKSPGFTATVVLTLALGIGANSAVFSAINAVLLRPLPFPNADRLVDIGQQDPKVPQTFVAPIRLEEWNRLNTTFTAISGFYTEDASEVSGELPERIKRAFVAPRFLQVLGVAPALGRDFAPAEEHFGGPVVILISDRLWRRRFGADPNAVGKTLLFGRSSVPIIGVMPASFLFQDRAVDIWAVAAPDAPFAQSRAATWYTTIGRMKPGVSLEQAHANLANVQANLGRQFPKTDAQISAVVKPLKEVRVAGVRKSLWILFGAVSLLLLIACANIAALLLSRAASRSHEIAVRFSLGASRAAVAAQLMTEVFVLAVTGSVLGLFLASGINEVFRSIARQLPRVEEIGLDTRIVIYSLAIAVLCTLLCGVLPALRGTRRDTASSLAKGSRAVVSGHSPIQLTLVGTQVALAVTLLVGAGLLARSLQEIGRVSPGFDAEHVLSFQISTSYGETTDYKALQQRMKRILDGLAALPGVESTAGAFSLPGIPSDYQVEFKTMEGRAETDPKLIAQGRTVTPNYFATMRIPVLGGELCREQAGSANMMVNRSFANAYFGGDAVIGHHLTLPSGGFPVTSAVLGIVGDAREQGMEREPVPTVYWCGGTNGPGAHYLLRTRGEPTAMIEAARRKVHELEPLRSVYNLSALVDLISETHAENRLRTILLGFFAAIAILLVSLGIYGTLSYMVSVRRREVALRMALGALRAQVVRQFLGQGIRVTVLGCIVGLALAAMFGRLFRSMLYGISTTDGTTLAGVAAIVMAVAALASLLPAIRASRLDPMQALREE